MKLKILMLALGLACLMAACAAPEKTVRDGDEVFKARNDNARTDNKFGANLPANAANSAADNKSARETINPRAAENGEARLKNPCLTASLPNKKIYPAQTFPIDFEPFRNACFVTFADPKQMVSQTDLPRGSEFHIFKDNKSVYQFPDAFDNQTGCWVTAVAFEDLNNDSMTDVVIAGKCLGAKNAYPQNMVYANTGDGFATGAENNQKLENFEKIKDIIDFAKRHQDIFF